MDLPVATPAARTRSGGLDAVRVVGIIAIVAGHVWPVATFRLVYPWHVPLFFVLAGYLWTPGRSVQTETRNRWRTLGLPYLTWLAISSVVLVAVRGAGHGLVRPLVYGIYGGYWAARPFSAFWFVTVLFGAALLFRFLERFGVIAQAAVAFVGIVAISGAPQSLATSPMSLALAPGCTVFLLAGLGLRRLRARLRRPALVGLGGIAVGAVLVGTGIADPVNLRLGDLGTPVLGLVVAVLIAGGLVLVGDALGELMPARVAAASTALATSGLAVVLGHQCVLLMFGTPRTGGWPDFVVALVAPWLAGLVALRTRAARALTGSPQREAAASVGAGRR